MCCASPTGTVHQSSEDQALVKHNMTPFRPSKRKTQTLLNYSLLSIHSEYLISTVTMTVFVVLLLIITAVSQTYDLRWAFSLWSTPRLREKECEQL